MRRSLTVSRKDLHFKTYLQLIIEKLQQMLNINLPDYVQSTRDKINHIKAIFKGNEIHQLETPEDSEDDNSFYF